MPGRRRRPLVAPLVVALPLAALLLPSVALANIAAPWDPGDPVAEPGGELAGVSIEREDLVLDLRPIESGAPALVGARYLVLNEGEMLETDLVFVSPGVQEGSVALDGALVAARPLADGVPLPASWQPPSRVQGIDGRPFEYQVRGEEGLAFSLAIPPGEHEIAVHYAAEPAAYHGPRPTREYALSYTLAPARTWASFGTLAVTVHVPPGWEAGTSVPLERAGDTLTGQFDGLPAGSLTVTTRPTNRAVPPLGLAALLLGTVALGGVGWWVAGVGLRRGWGAALGCTVLLVLGLGGGILFSIAAAAAVSTEHSLLLGGHASRSFAYTAGYVVLGTGALGLLLGAGAPVVGFLVRHARERRRRVSGVPAQGGV